MKISSIQVQLKNASRYSIFVDGKYVFSLSADALLESHLICGQEVTEAEVNRFKQLSADDKAYGLALAYVARRLRSEWELRDYCKRKGYAPELTEAIISRLNRSGFVDDEIFARRWVENRRLLKATSAKKLRLELRQKRIADDIISAVLAEDETDERQVLRELIEKKRKQTKYQDDQKLMMFLARQGFSYDDIKAVLKKDGFCV